MIDEKIQDQVAALVDQVGYLTREVRTLKGVVAALADQPVSAKVCQGCKMPVPPNPDGTLPVHEINGLVVGRQRRTTSVCRYRPGVVA